MFNFNHLFYLIIITINLSFCMSCKKNFYDKERFNLYKDVTNQVSYLPPNENFVFLKKVIMINDMDGSLCHLGLAEYTMCNTPWMPVVSASGYIIEKKKNTITAITAAHWCFIDENQHIDSEGRVPVIKGVVNFLDNDYRIKKYQFNLEHDVCFVEFESRDANLIKNIKIAKEMPKIGEKIYTISAPMWSHENSLRYHFEGRFSGKYNDKYYFTIPATYGSSGSAVINESGEIISIITESLIDFQNLSSGPSLDVLKTLVEERNE